jgi:hypothetical protein
MDRALGLLMTQRMKQAILSLLVVGQLGVIGCATPQVERSAPTLTTTSQGLSSTAGRRALPQTQSSLRPVYMGMGFGNLEASQRVILYTAIGLVIVTAPVWAPFYLVYDWLDRF